MEEKQQRILEDELLKIIADQVRVSPLSVTLSMTVIAYLMYRNLPGQPWIWGGWMAAVVVTQLYRIYRLPMLPAETHRSPRARVREAAAINMAGIFIQSLSLLSFPLFTPFEASVQTMAFLGMGVGSIVTAVGWAPFALTHIWITLLPTFGLWAWSGFYGPAGPLGILIAIVGVSYTITMWFISKSLYRMNEELFESRTALGIALEEAESASAAKTRFLAAASHDLRQPLHTLSLFSAALGMRQLDERTSQISASIDGAIRALSSELDALLDVSKLDAGIVPVNPVNLDLDKLLQRLCEEFEALAGAANINIKINIECPGHAITKTDPVLLERIIRNIFTNAITHNTNCSVNASVWKKDGHWQVTLSDTGMGIPLSEHKNIFEEFFQIQNPERDRSKGLGLGLSIVKRLSALLELDMKFESAPGSGTTFRFSLPLARGDAIVLEKTEAYIAALKATRVLVVDDEAAVREGMKTLLELLGCRVDLADNTETAVSLALLERPDIALVDYRLCGTDSGLITIARLREHYRDMPAILVSGDTGPDRLQEAKAAGITMLSKPVSREVLCNAIARACQMPDVESTRVVADPGP